MSRPIELSALGGFAGVREDAEGTALALSSSAVAALALSMVLRLSRPLLTFGQPPFGINMRLLGLSSRSRLFGTAARFMRAMRLCPRLMCRCRCWFNTRRPVSIRPIVNL